MSPAFLSVMMQKTYHFLFNALQLYNLGSCNKKVEVGNQLMKDLYSKEYVQKLIKEIGETSQVGLSSNTIKKKTSTDDTSMLVR